jgi:hypothetical protein
VRSVCGAGEQAERSKRGGAPPNSRAAEETASASTASAANGGSGGAAAAAVAAVCTKPTTLTARQRVLPSERRSKWWLSVAVWPSRSMSVVVTVH